MKVASEQSVAMGKRVLVFSSIGHALMHMMTAFYAVIVLTLAVTWDLAPERLLELYAPSAILLGVMSLPAGWASDRFGAPLMMVVMFVGLGLSSIACGLVATGDTFALMLALCGLGVFGAIYHSVGIGWIIRTAKEQGHAMGVNGLWGSAGLALYGIVPGVLITLASWRAAFIVPGVVCVAVGAVLAWQIRQGKVGDRPMPATAGVQTGKREFWRVFSVLSVTMALEGIVWAAVMFGAALVFETRLADDIAGLRALLASWGLATQVVLWVGLATSMIYVVSGIAQYAMGRTIIDRYPLKTTYVIASALQVPAMLALAMGNGYLALLGRHRLGGAELGFGADREHPDRALHAQPLSRAGLRREVRGGAGRQPDRHHADRLGARDDRQPGAAVPRPHGCRRRDHPGGAAAALRRTGACRRCRGAAAGACRIGLERGPPAQLRPSYFAERAAL